MIDPDLDADPVDASTVIALTERVTLALHEFTAERDVVAHRLPTDHVAALLRQLSGTPAA